MRHFFLLIASACLSGCSLPFVAGHDPYAPTGDTEVMREARGETVAIQPITTVPGSIWPGPMQKMPSMADLVKQEAGEAWAEMPNRPPSVPQVAPVVPPLPQAAKPNSPLSDTAITARDAYKTVLLPDGRSEIVVPNGNGTNTLILSDGHVEIVPEEPLSLRSGQEKGR